LLNKIKYDLITILINLKVVNKLSEENDTDLKNKKIDPSLIGKKIGRNEPCFCGSKKKYKHCCGSL
jgi:Predicted metal-binding protein related to the C-terminal domain of SecA